MLTILPDLSWWRWKSLLDTYNQNILSQNQWSQMHGWVCECTKADRWKSRVRREKALTGSNVRTRYFMLHKIKQKKSLKTSGFCQSSWNFKFLLFFPLLKLSKSQIFILSDLKKVFRYCDAILQCHEPTHRLGHHFFLILGTGRWFSR